MHNALLPLLRLILSFGMRGDYNLLRRLALRCPMFRPLHFLYGAFHGSVLPLRCTIRGPICFPHEPTGVFLSTTCVIGRGCTIMQHVTIGSNFVTKVNGGVELPPWAITSLSEPVQKSSGPSTSATARR